MRTAVRPTTTQLKDAVLQQSPAAWQRTRTTLRNCAAICRCAVHVSKEQHTHMCCTMLSPAPAPLKLLPLHACSETQPTPLLKHQVPLQPPVHGMNSAITSNRGDDTAFMQETSKVMQPATSAVDSPAPVTNSATTSTCTSGCISSGACTRSMYACSDASSSAGCHTGTTVRQPHGALRQQDCDRDFEPDTGMYAANHRHEISFQLGPLHALQQQQQQRMYGFRSMRRTKHNQQIHPAQCAHMHAQRSKACKTPHWLQQTTHQPAIHPPRPPAAATAATPYPHAAAQALTW